MSRYPLTLTPSQPAGQSVGLTLKLTPKAAAIEEAEPVAGALDCPVPYCLVQWVGPWIISNPGPITGVFECQITQRIYDEVVTPDDPETEENEEVIIPGGSNNCRIPLVWVLSLTIVEGEFDQLEDFSITEIPESIAGDRAGSWNLYGNGGHAAEYPFNIGVVLHARAYLQDRVDGDGNPVPFGDEITWSIS